MYKDVSQNTSDCVANVQIWISSDISNPSVCFCHSHSIPCCIVDPGMFSLAFYPDPCRSYGWSMVYWPLQWPARAGRDVKAGSGSWNRNRWNRSFLSVEAEARKFYRFRFHIGYLTWRATWRKSFVDFPMWIKRWSCAISLNERAISVARENEIKHNLHPWRSSQKAKSPCSLPILSEADFSNLAAVY